MSNKTARRTIIGIVSGVAAVGMLFGMSAAYWTGGGGGTGSVVTAMTTPEPLVVTQTEVTGLVPGGCVALYGMINNPNTMSVMAGTLTASVDPADRSLRDFFFTGDPTAKVPSVAINTVVPAGSGISWSGMNLCLKDTVDNQDQYKGKTVTVTYAVA